MIGPLATEYGGKSAARTGADTATAAIAMLATTSFFTWAPAASPIFWGAILTKRPSIDVPFAPHILEKHESQSSEIPRSAHQLGGRGPAGLRYCCRNTITHPRLVTVPPPLTMALPHSLTPFPVKSPAGS